MKLSDIDFLIIGATKSATTWLQHSLQRDPQVYMPAPELHYFSREFQRGDDWYLSHFKTANSAHLVGEKSNSYLDSQLAASRIRAALPDVKLIAQLRNPIERAYSDYCMLYRRGEVGRDLSLYFDPDKALNSRFLVGGLYHQHIRRYLDYFPESQLLILLYEDLAINSSAQLGRFRRFIGLEDELPTQPIQMKVKDKTLPVINPSLRRLFGPLKPVVAPIRQTWMFDKVRNLLARETAYPPLTGRLHKQMAAFYAEDTRALGVLIGRDVSGWLTSDPEQLAGRRKEGTL